MNDKLLAALVLTKDEALMLYPELEGYYSMMSEARKFSGKFKTIRERNIFLSATAKKYFESRLS